MMQMNSKLDPKFKLSRIDLEDRSSSLHLGSWNRDPSREFLIKTKKEQRRKDYWHRRIVSTDGGIYHTHTQL